MSSSFITLRSVPAVTFSKSGRDRKSHSQLVSDISKPLSSPHRRDKRGSGLLGHLTRICNLAESFQSRFRTLGLPCSVRPGEPRSSRRRAGRRPRPPHLSWGSSTARGTGWWPGKWHSAGNRWDLTRLDPPDPRVRYRTRRRDREGGPKLAVGDRGRAHGHCSAGARLEKEEERSRVPESILE